MPITGCAVSKSAVALTDVKLSSGLKSYAVSLKCFLWYRNFQSFKKQRRKGGR